jgi:hypothetical protein
MGIENMYLRVKNLKKIHRSEYNHFTAPTNPIRYLSKVKYKGKISDTRV